MPLTYLTSPEEYQRKEQLYLDVRRREGRVLTDDQLRELPNVTNPPELAREWRWRKRAFRRLDKYLNNRFPNKLIRILDLGCGNGWMSNLLAQNALLRSITALDLNEAELQQAARVFRRYNLQFVYGNILKNGLPEQSFEVIVLAASVQYFPQLKELIPALKKLLTANGEIHIIDSRFYAGPEEAAAAKKRTEAYYGKMGVPEMADFYHHHLWQEAQELGAEDLDAGMWAWMMRKWKVWAPFRWVRIV